MGGTCSTQGMTDKYIQYVRKPEWMIPVGRRRHRWKNNIRMDRRKVGWGGMV